jgi:hypothetical protein
MRGLPSALFYMIMVGFRTKICTAFSTANQFACPNLIKLLGCKNGGIILKIIYSTVIRSYSR